MDTSSHMQNNHSGKRQTTALKRCYPILVLCSLKQLPKVIHMLSTAEMKFNGVQHFHAKSTVFTQVSMP